MQASQACGATRRLRNYVLNAVLAVASIAFTYLIIELVFFRFFLPYAALNIRTHLPDIAGVLVQNSKAEFAPHDYIAILGDSYAEGVGDWLLQAHGDRTKPFHSAHIIREATGRDIVSFGRVGAGSAQALVGRPATIFAGSECYFFPRIEAPREMVVYFYEGNDIEDNEYFLARVMRKYGSTSDGSIDRTLIEDFAAVPPWKCHTYLADTMGRMAKFLFQHHVQNVTFAVNPPRDNILLMAGERVAVPRVHGPGLAYSDDQVHTAMRVLDRSLAWLKGRFPDIPTTVVYIPSAASIYRFATEMVVTGQGSQPSIKASTAHVAQRSDLMNNLARTASLSHGVAFLDARPALRRAAETRLLHGPIDWSHFNEVGYRILGGLVVQQTTAASSTPPQ